MYSREESKNLRETFWISFGKSFPRKWILYRTKVKGLVLRFYFDVRKAVVSLEVDTYDLNRRMVLWETLLALRPILVTEYLPEAQFQDTYCPEPEKEVSRVFVEMHGVSIHNKDSWGATMIFLDRNMVRLEDFFREYQGLFSEVFPGKGNATG